MFARRRSLSSLEKLPCLNIAFLTFFLLVISHVSSMSLDRQRRQYQQQNDKQLELSELMLPEAESEMLQNDMELVPAVDGNSDMYLLVPASAASQEQNLQTLTEPNELQNSGKVESESDMLMQESEDAPAMQIFKLPEDKFKTQNLKEFVANNELDHDKEQTLNDADQVSVSTLNNIAEAAQEIENEIETELVAGSEPSTKIEELIQAEHAKQAEKNMSSNEFSVEDEDAEAENADASVQVGEPIKSAESETAIEIEDQKVDVTKNEMELQATTGIPMETQSVEDMQFVDELQSTLDSQSTFEEEITKEDEKHEENQQTVETEDDEEVQHIEDKDKNGKQSQTVKEEAIFGAETPSIEDDENVDRKNSSDHEIQILGSSPDSTSDEFDKLQSTLQSHIFETDKEKITNEESQISELNGEDEVQSTYEEQIPKEDEQHEEIQQNMKVQGGEEVQHIADKDENAEKSQTLLEEAESGAEIPSIENTEQEIQSDHKIQSFGLTPDSSSDEFNKFQSTLGSHIFEADEEKITKEESQISELNGEDEVQSTYEEQIAKGDEVQDIEDKGQYIEDKDENAEQSQTVQEGAESAAEAFTIESAENGEEDSPSDQEIHILGSSPVSTSDEFDRVQLEAFNQADKEEGTDEESQISELKGEDEVQSAYEEQISKENEKHEETQQIMEVQDDEKVQHLDDTDENAEQSQTVQKGPESEAESPSIEDAETAEDFQSNAESQPIKEIQSNEESQDAEKAQINEVEQSPEELQATDEVQNIEDAQLEETLPIKNSQIPEKTQHEEDTQYVEEAQPTESTQSVGDTVTVEEAQSDELSQIVENNQTIEESKPADENESVVDSQSIEDAQAVEEGQSNEHAQNESSQVVNDVEEESKPSEEYQTEADVSDTAQTTSEDVKPGVSGMEMQSLFEEAEPINAQPLVPAPEMQQSEIHEFAVEQQQSQPDGAKPLEITDDKLTVEESKEQDEEEIAGQSIVLDNENILQNIASIETNQYEKVQDATVEIKKPLEDKDADNILNNYTNESEQTKETTSMLTTIVQVPTNEELTQQQHQEHEQLQEQQPAVEETVNLDTSKPFNVLDSVLNYVNASYINHMSTADNNEDNIKQEVNEEEELFSSKLRRYDGAQVWRIVVQNDRERKLADELQTKYDGQLWKEVKQEVDYLLKPQVLADAEKYVRAANLTRIVLIDNLQKVIEVENPSAEEIAQLQNRKGYRLTWQAYHRLEDIHGYFDYLAKTYPDICSIEVIGYSIEKRPLKILKISNGNANNTGLWIDGGMHAREWVSPAVVTYIANQIVEGWDDLPAYMRNVNWYLHAVANPDGYEYSHTTDRLWRKNMRSHGRACPGVDLNRNFGYKWGGKGTSANPCSQTYRGSKAFSEPETFYIAKFITNLPRETFKGYLSFHSYGQYILYPWGYDYHFTSDMPDLDLVARQAGTIITKSSGSKFTVGSSATTLYPAAGGSDDWAKGIAGIKYAYTIEMGDTGRYGFVLPADHIEPNGKNGFTIVQTLAKAITMGKNGRRRKLKAYKSH